MTVKPSLLLLSIPVLMLLSGCTGFDPNAYVPGLYTPTAVQNAEATPLPYPVEPPMSVAEADPSVAVEDSSETRVCTNIHGGKLNVRFEPGEKSDVRGYLAEGETVTLNGDRQDVDGNAWVKLSRPIEGWVNKTYLCEEK